MAIPNLNEHGLLPSGLHDCSFEEIEERFGKSSWVGNRLVEVRQKLCRILDLFLKEVRSTDMALEIIIDGSFTTGEPEPHDIDLILVLPQDHDFTREVRPFEYNILSKKQVRKTYGFDVLVARAGSAERQEYEQLFRQVRNRPGLVKGSLRVCP